MGVWILRFVLVVICGVSGYTSASNLSSSPLAGLGGLLGGCLVAAVTFFVENRLKRIPFKSLIGSLVGLFLGIMVANLISKFFFSDLWNPLHFTLPLYGSLYGVCGYMGLRIGLKKGEEIHWPGWKPFSKGLPRGESPGYPGTRGRGVRSCMSVL